MKSSVILFSFVYSVFTISCNSEWNPLFEKRVHSDSIRILDSILISDSLEIHQLVEDYDLGRTDTFDVGDLNGDGNPDKAFIQPLTFFFHNGKMDSQYVNITFDCSIPPIKHNNGFHGMVVNAEDLDGNGTDEIIYFPDWYQSMSAGIYIYGFRNDHWELFQRGAIRWDIVVDQSDPMAYLKSRVKKIDNQSFYLTEHLWTWDFGEIIDSTSVVIIK